jgi:hypothetical protein
MSLRPVESTEGTFIPTDIGVIDIAIDEKSGDLPGMLIPAGGISSSGKFQQTGFPEQNDCPFRT